MRKARFLVAALLLVLLLAACTPQAAPVAVAQSPAPAVAVPAPAPAAAPAKPAWQGEWEKVQTEAQKEGTVVIAITAGQLRLAIVEAMRRYGVKAETIVGRQSEFNAKVLAERRAGLYLWDISISGIAVYTDLEPARALAPLDPALILPDVTDPELIKKTWFKGKLWWAESDHFVLSTLMYPYPPLAINTNVVKPGEIKSYNDLLDPRWKGRMTIDDPTIPGSTYLSYMLRISGVDWVRKLTKQEPIVMRDRRLQLEWLTHGKTPINLGVHSPTYTEFKSAGAPIQVVVPVEGAWLSTGASAINMFERAPHANATKVFVNWYLSKEGQTTVSKLLGGQSAREDVPTDFLPPDQIRQPGVEYWEKETKEIQLQRQKDMSLFKDIFQDLVK